MFSAFAILKICLSLTLAEDKCKKRPKLWKNDKKQWKKDEQTMKKTMNKRWTNEHVVTIVYGLFSNFYFV